MRFLNMINGLVLHGFSFGSMALLDMPITVNILLSILSSYLQLYVSSTNQRTISLTCRSAHLISLPSTSLRQAFISMAVNWLRNANHDSLMYQMFHRFVLINSGLLHSSASWLSNWPTLAEYVETIRFATGQKGLSLISGMSETRRKRFGEPICNLVHISARSMRRRTAVTIEPGIVPAFLFQAILEELPQGVHVGILAVDGMMITPSCQYDSNARKLRGLINAPPVDTLFQKFKVNRQHLKNHVNHATRKDNMATTVVQYLLTLPGFPSIPPIPITYELRGKWTNSDEVVQAISKVKKLLEVCEECFLSGRKCHITMTAPNANSDSNTHRDNDTGDDVDHSARDMNASSDEDCDTDREGDCGESHRPLIGGALLGRSR